MSAPEAERLARAALSRMFEPAVPRISALVSEHGAVAILEALRARPDLQQLRSDADPRLAGLDPESDLERAARIGVRFVVPGDAEWPAQLGDLHHVEQLLGQGGAPLGLWVRGPARLEQLVGSVAVVGARSATSYGETIAGEIAARLATAGRWVVSGAAFGIDQAAHRGALAGPPGGECRTVAVLACGADRVYPSAHRRLLEHLAAEGAVVSEVPPGCAPLRQRFLSRNRLIAALTAATVVVEAAARSGALNTASWAERLHRPVMGVPGPVTSEPSVGVHQLIRAGGATLVTGAGDVLELIGAAGEHLVDPPRAPVRPRDRLATRDQQVLDAVPVVTAAPTPSIARTAGVAISEVAAALERLLAGGFVERAQGGWRLDPAGPG